MTEAEQHAVLGRLLFDKKKASERLANSHEKGKQLWRDMTMAAKAMELELNKTDPCENVRNNFLPRGSFDPFEEKTYPEKDQIIKVLNEIRKSKEDIEEYQARIKSIIGHTI